MLWRIARRTHAGICSELAYSGCPVLTFRLFCARTRKRQSMSTSLQGWTSRRVGIRDLLAYWGAGKAILGISRSFQRELNRSNVRGTPARWSQQTCKVRQEGRV